MRTGYISRILGKQAKLDREVLVDTLQEVAEERDLLNLIFEEMTEGVLVFDSLETLRFANRRAGELLGFDHRLSRHKPLASFIKDEDLIEPIRGCLRSGEERKGVEAILIQEEPRAVRLEIVPLYGDQGRFEGALVMVLEITEEKRREAEKRESKRLAALATLSASLAHEIRNPLNSMGIHVQLLERNLRKQGLQNLLKTTSIIRDEIQNLNERLSLFLDAARPRRPQFEEVSAHNLIEETLDLMQPELHNNGIRVEYYPPGVHITFFVDRVDLRRAFVNIIKNAIEAMPEGGTLIIRVHEDSDWIVIEFEDNGEGIPGEIRDHVLELGFTTKDTGSGLGLAQVDRCIREHSGTLEIHPRKGGGTCIHIRLPVLSQGKRLLGLAPAQQTGSQ
ncbi:MAG: hypothetical protein AMXMBFR75_08050 [Candidatus Hinthialibacteria bacterium]